jgi:hypothetical protein
MFRHVKRWIVLGALVVAVAAFLGMRMTDHAGAPLAATTAADRSPTASPGSPGGAPRDVPDRVAPNTAAPPIRAPIHVRRIDPAEREAIEKRIADARAARASATAAGGPPIPDHVDQLDLEHAPPELIDALHESIPIVAECFRTDGVDARPDGAAVLLTLRGADDGTLVDPDQITDTDGKPLDGRLTQCLHTTLDSLELPPLGANQELPIQFTFRP